MLPAAEIPGCQAWLHHLRGSEPSIWAQGHLELSAHPIPEARLWVDDVGVLLALGSFPASVCLETRCPQDNSSLTPGCLT